MSHSVVIGGAGFVGSWVVDEILKNPRAQVTIIDNLISSEKWNISTDPRVTFIRGSAAEFPTFERVKGAVDFVYHLACFHGNQSSIARPIDDLENGLKTTLVLLEWVRKNHPKARVVYAGAGCAVADKTWDAPSPIKEIDSTHILHDSPYSISKISGEMYCVFYAHQHNMHVVRIRFQNVYGPREILGAGIWRGTEHTIWRNVIPTFIWKALHGQELEIFGEFRASRDFIYVSDLARGVLMAAKHGTPNEVYNLASGKEKFIDELALSIVELTNSKSCIRNSAKRHWDSSGRRFADITKSNKELNFLATTDFREGLITTIEWTIENEDRIATTISSHNESQGA